MKEYEVEVIQKNIVYVNAESESQAISRAIRDVQMIAPDEVECHILPSSEQ